VEADGLTWDDHPAFAVIDRMLELERAGKLRGAGFYDYEDGKRTGLWTGLAQEFPPTDDPASIVFKDLEERMLFIESIETVKCLDEGVIETVSDANIGSIFGIGFPAWTGGAMQFIYGTGVDAFLRRAEALAAKFGAGFVVDAKVREAIEQFRPVY